MPGYNEDKRQCEIILEKGMHFDVWRLNHNRQIMCIFKILYCDILVSEKAKTKGYLFKHKKHVILLSTLQCMILERVSFQKNFCMSHRSTNLFCIWFSYHRAWSLLDKMSGGLKWVEDFKSKFNSKSAKNLLLLNRLWFQADIPPRYLVKAQFWSLSVEVC